MPEQIKCEKNQSPSFVSLSCDTRNQGISSKGIDLYISECDRLITRKVKFPDFAFWQISHLWLPWTASMNCTIIVVQYCSVTLVLIMYLSRPLHPNTQVNCQMAQHTSLKWSTDLILCDHEREESKWGKLCDSFGHQWKTYLGNCIQTVICLRSHLKFLSTPNVRRIKYKGGWCYNGSFDG